MAWNIRTLEESSNRKQPQFWPLALARELDDAILHLRLNEPDLGLLLLRTDGDPQAVLAADRLLEAHASDWLVREIRLLMKRSIDVILAAAALVLLCPVLLLIALLIRRDPQHAAALHLLLSKVDQINTVQRRAALAAALARARALPLAATVQLFSARGGEGVEALRARVAQLLG